MYLLGNIKVPGDYDNNRVVDAADYDQWKDAFGQPVANPGDGADGNGDGVVDAADYTVWRDHLTLADNGPFTSPVPEPVTLLLLTVGWMGLERRRTRRETS
jgi:hypothetical protein